MFDDLSILILDIERATLVNIHERGSFCIDRLLLISLLSHYRVSFQKQSCVLLGLYDHQLRLRQ